MRVFQILKVIDAQILEVLLQKLQNFKTLCTTKDRNSFQDIAFQISKVINKRFKIQNFVGIF